MYFVKVKKNK